MDFLAIVKFDSCLSKLNFTYCGRIYLWTEFFDIANQYVSYNASGEISQS